jgi:hypothetical protein
MQRFRSGSPAGCSISQISRELDLERGTVYRFARAGGLDELLVKTTLGRPRSTASSPIYSAAGTRAA